MRSLLTLRRGVLLLWSALFALVLATVLLSHAIGLVGARSMIIRGRSMEPTIPLGSVVAIREVAPEAIRPGDVITLQDRDRPVFTHRVVRVEAAGDGSLQFITRGDANDQEDAQPVPAAAVMGRVEVSVPWIGYLLAILSMPTGMTSVLCGMASILCAVMLLEEDERAARSAIALAPTPAGGADGPLPDHATDPLHLSEPMPAAGPGLPGLT